MFHTLGSKQNLFSPPKGSKISSLDNENSNDDDDEA